jgi:tetratricopeptide (TPR) repeat protein
MISLRSPAYTIGEKRLIIYFLLIAVLLLGSIGFTPKILALYNQVRGARLLSEAFRTVNGHSSVSFSCSTPPVSDETAKYRLQEAVIVLNKALRYNSASSHPYLLLGRVYCLQGKYKEAVKAYNQYTFMRPENPLGYLELGFAYSEIHDQYATVQAWKAANVTAKDFLIVGALLQQSMHFSEAMDWYKWAGILRGVIYDHIDEMPMTNLTVIESFSTTEQWKICSWCSNGNGEFNNKQGVLEISLANSVAYKDEYAIYTTLNCDLSGFTSLNFYVKGKPEASLTVEWVIDNIRARPIQNQPLTSSWQMISIPIKGNFLNELLISLGEVNSSSTTREHVLLMDWIALK